MQIMAILLTEYQTKYYAYELTKRCPADSLEKLASALVDAQVDQNTLQVDAAPFAIKSPLKLLSQKLAAEFGRGFSVDNLQRMRVFYLMYKKYATPSRILEGRKYQFYLPSKEELKKQLE